MYHKWESYDVCFLRYRAWRTVFFVILDYFLPFYPPNNPKNQNFQKLKKAPGDAIILHRCTINDNYMMYGSWDTECDGQNILSFWTMFCPFNNPKNPNFEKLKKVPGDIIILHKCTKNHDICYTFSELWCVTDVILLFFILGYFLPFYLPSSLKNQN